MADEADNGSFELRLGRALDSIDEVSRKLEDSIKEKLDRKGESKDSVSRDEEGFLESSNSESLLVRTREGVEKIGGRGSSTVENANIPEKAAGFGNWMKGAGQSIGSSLKSVGSYLPYIIPATEIFQTALWKA